MRKPNQLSPLHISSLILAVALLACLLHLPYGFYTIIRLATAIIAACWAYILFKNGKTALAIIAAGVVILFQPLFKITLDRMTWNVADVILAIALIAISLFTNTKKQ